MGSRDNACIIGAGMTQFGKHMDRSLAELAREAVVAALAAAQVEAGEVDLLVVSNSMAGLLQGQESVRGQAMFADGRFAGVPVVNVENACASGATAVQVAGWALAAGSARTVVALGVEKLFHEDKAATFSALASASDVGGTAASGRSVFMDFYAARARDHMAAYGTTVEMIAEVAAKNRRHGAANPLAQFREAVTREDVLAARMVVAPLTLLMCSPISDGAAALVLRRRAEVGAGRPAVSVRAQALRSGSVAGPEFLTIGAAAPLIENAALRASYDSDKIISAHTLQEAVHQARKRMPPGGTVVLSPACASFDQFASYEQRGETFRSLVLGLRA